MRYSGAPLAMGFGEAGQKKTVIIVETKNSRDISVRDVPVPIFHRMDRISGTYDEILQELTRLKMEDSPALVEVVLEDPRIIPDAQEKIRSIIQGTPIEVLKVKSQRLSEQALQSAHDEESLARLTPEEVFIRRMDAAEITRDDRQDLLESFREIYTKLLEEDNNSE